MQTIASYSLTKFQTEIYIPLASRLEKRCKLVVKQHPNLCTMHIYAVMFPDSWIYEYHMNTYWKAQFRPLYFSIISHLMYNHCELLGVIPSRPTVPTDLQKNTTTNKNHLSFRHDTEHKLLAEWGKVFNFWRPTLKRIKKKIWTAVTEYAGDVSLPFPDLLAFKKKSPYFLTLLDLPNFLYFFSRTFQTVWTVLQLGYQP